MISNLHYISQEINGKDHIQNIEEACKAGIDWVQLRVKDQPAEEVEVMAYEAKAICKKYGAKLIINDYVEIAKAVKSYGVHLGKNDMDPTEARKILGDQPYIGCTANTFEDVQKLYSAGVDYIGLGPFKETITKENLSPILGVRGYSTILNNMIIHEIDIPIIAIGGIELEDVMDIQLTGCYGIAVASLINLAEDKQELIEDIKLLLPNISDDQMFGEGENDFGDEFKDSGEEF